MSKPRYSLYIEGVTTATAVSQSQSYSFDIRKVLPLNLEGRKFILRSSFSIGQFAYSLGTIRISINMPSTYNVSQKGTSLVPIGLAKPITSDMDSGNGLFMYNYDESDCYPCMIDYPRLNNIEVQLEGFTAIDIPIDTGYRLRLSFELID